ncbi:hypothetical protein AVEN_74528-1 [Araneus ventricosus]|uniref:Uncharacterized protein n=1 Tax=Araneus ventricosus TaxID=182803 RepID=A0A4Y2GRX4_ARAVE|nr:hypothetical protein AVEN_74528-1 [Araneus ventricosus]
MAGRGGLVVRFRLKDQRVPGSKPDSTEDPPCMGPVARYIIEIEGNNRSYTPPVLLCCLIVVTLGGMGDVRLEFFLLERSLKA